MQIIAEYDKNSDLRCHNKPLFKTVDKFLNGFPSEYRKLYDKNLETLKLFRCDVLDRMISTGLYDAYDNIIFYSRSNSLGHELFHVASNNLKERISAIDSNIGREQGLSEGMTEYLFMKAFGLSEPDSYAFETFAVMMLDSVPNLFQHYFIPNHSEFIKIFPSRKDIYNLMFSLSLYNEESTDYLSSLYNAKDESDILIDVNLLKKAIRETINNLITIELSMEKDHHLLKEYGTKFMDLIGSSDVFDMLSTFYPRYYNYAEKQIKERILKR